MKTINDIAEACIGYHTRIDNARETITAMYYAKNKEFIVKLCQVFWQRELKFKEEQQK